MMTVNVNVAVIGDDIEFPSRHFKMCVCSSSRAPAWPHCARINFHRMCNTVAFSLFNWKKSRRRRRNRIFIYIFFSWWRTRSGILVSGFSPKFCELQLTTAMLYSLRPFCMNISIARMNRRTNLHEFTCIFLEYLLNFSSEWMGYSTNRRNVSLPMDMSTHYQAILIENWYRSFFPFVSAWTSLPSEMN